MAKELEQPLESTLEDGDEPEGYTSGADDIGEMFDYVYGLTDSVEKLSSDVALMLQAIRELGFGDGAQVNTVDVALMKRIISAQQTIIKEMLLRVKRENSQEVMALPEWRIIEEAGRQLDNRTRLRHSVGNSEHGNDSD